MTRHKRFETFTLGRMPFLLFVAAGISGMTLSTLFQGALSAAIVLALSMAVIGISLVARFRALSARA